MADAAVTVRRVGRFHWTDGEEGWRDRLGDQAVALLRGLHATLDDAYLRETLVPLQRQEHRVPARAIDWAVVNYSKKYRTAYRYGARLVVLHDRYQEWLKRYGRDLFDPFRRGKRIAFRLAGAAAATAPEADEHETTVAQLNFHVFMQTYGVLEFTEQHLGAIQDELRVANASRRERRRKGGPKPKRSRLTQPPPFRCYVYAVKQLHTFDSATPAATDPSGTR